MLQTFLYKGIAKGDIENSSLLPFSHHSINMHELYIMCCAFSMKEKKPSVFMNSGLAAGESK